MEIDFLVDAGRNISLEVLDMKWITVFKLSIGIVIKFFFSPKLFHSMRYGKWERINARIHEKKMPTNDGGTRVFEEKKKKSIENEKFRIA